MGRVVSVTDDQSQKENYTYSPKGELLSKIDQDGYLTKYGYTAYGDVKHIQYADGKEVKLGYNPLRHLQEVEDWLGITKIETDANGRTKKVTYPDGKELSYTFGKSGEKTSITYPDGRKVQYGYDQYQRLSELRDGDNVIRYAYDNASYLKEKKFPNGMKTAYDYDEKGLITSLIHSDKEGILDSYQYGYDASGNKVRIEKSRRGLKEENGNYAYGYDPIGRLTSVEKEGYLQSFGYTGYQRDNIAGTYYAQAREYSSENGRFISEDIIKGYTVDPLNMNHYSYCWNSPMDLVDNDGEWPSWNDIKNGAKNIASKAVKAVKSVPWKQVAIVAGSAVAVVAVTVATAGVGTVAATALAGATIGAAANVSARAVTDIALGQDSSWKDYIADGTSGAIAGGVGAVNPALRGMSLGIIDGGVSAAVSGILHGKSLRQTAISVLANGAFGAFTGKVGDFAGDLLKNTKLARFIRELNECGYKNLNMLGARGKQAWKRMMTTYFSYKIPNALYKLLTQELNDIFGDALEGLQENYAQCIEGN